MGSVGEIVYRPGRLCLVKISVSSEVFKLFLTETGSYRECGEWVLELNV